jgi:hypothetical protein
MGALFVVFDEPDVEIGLQLVDRLVDFLAERNSVELVQDRAMETLANAVNGGGKLGQMPAPEPANSAPFSDGGGCVSALARALPT